MRAPGRRSCVARLLLRAKFRRTAARARSSMWLARCVGTAAERTLPSLSLRQGG